MDSQIETLENELNTLKKLNEEDLNTLKNESMNYLKEIDLLYSKELQKIDNSNINLQKESTELLLLFNKLKSITKNNCK